MVSRALVRVAVALALCTVSVPVAAQTPAPPATAATTDDDARERAASVDALLAQLRTDNPALRREALAGLDALGPADVPALRARLLAPLGLPSLAVHAAMVRVVRPVLAARPNADYDLLELLARNVPHTPDADVALERVAIARALGTIGTSDAGRALVAFAFAHDRIFRLETQRIIRNQLHEAVLPALIELRRPTDEMRAFIRQVRESIHRVSVGESVQTRDNALLAEILRAYGQVRQPDALNVIASFLNSDRSQVRDAAREAMAQYGRDGIIVLRQTYENSVGTDPDPAWGWERTTRALYAAFDRRRADEVAHALDEGNAAAAARDWPTMLARYEFVLARHPLYERRAEMAPGLVAAAHAYESTDAVKAEGIYRRALRIAPEGPQANAIRSAILFVEAERALAQGVADPALYRAALTADPSNARARAQYEAVSQETALAAKQHTRWIAAGGLVAVALAVLAWLASRAKVPAKRVTVTQGAAATDTEPTEVGTDGG